MLLNRGLGIVARVEKMRKGWSPILLLRFSVAVFAVLSITCGAVGSQVAKERSYLVGTGIGLPLEPSYFTNRWGLGMNLGFGVECSLSSVVSLRGNLDLNIFNHSATQYPYWYQLSGGQKLVLGPTIAAIVSVPYQGNFLRSYFIGGSGIYALLTRKLEVSAYSYLATEEGYSQLALPIFLGHGYKFPLNNRVSLFVEGKYVVCFHGKTTTEFLALRVGFSFRPSILQGGKILETINF